MVFFCLWLIKSLAGSLAVFFGELACGLGCWSEGERTFFSIRLSAGDSISMPLLAGSLVVFSESGSGLGCWLEVSLQRIRYGWLMRTLREYHCWLGHWRFSLESRPLGHWGAIPGGMGCLGPVVMCWRSRRLFRREQVSSAFFFSFSLNYRWGAFWSNTRWGWIFGTLLIRLNSGTFFIAN